MLERIPSAAGVEEIAQHVDAALIKKLEVRRFGVGLKKTPRGKKVPAGQSHTMEEEEEEELSEDEMMSEEESSEEEEEAETREVEEEEEDVDALLEDPPRDLRGHVVAEYEGQWFLTEVCADQTGVPKGYSKLNYMVIKGNNSFAWGAKADLLVTPAEDIILTHVVPEPVNSRGHLGLKKADHAKVLAWMVVVYFLTRKIHYNFLISES